MSTIHNSRGTKLLWLKHWTIIWEIWAEFLVSPQNSCIILGSSLSVKWRKTVWLFLLLSCLFRLHTSYNRDWLLLCICTGCSEAPRYYLIWVWIPQQRQHQKLRIVTVARNSVHTEVCSKGRIFQFFLHFVPSFSTLIRSCEQSSVTFSWQSG